MGVWRGSNNPTLLKKTIVEKPPRNSAGFCGGGQGLSWAVEPRKEEEEEEEEEVQPELGDTFSGSL
jgi:hypothetical protein